MLAKQTVKNQITLPKTVIARFGGVEYFDVSTDGETIVLRLRQSRLMRCEAGWRNSVLRNRTLLPLFPGRVKRYESSCCLYCRIRPSIYKRPLDMAATALERCRLYPSRFPVDRSRTHSCSRVPQVSFISGRTPGTPRRLYAVLRDRRTGGAMSANLSG